MSDSPFDSALIQALTEPFHPMFVEWKPQATTKDGKRALAAAYVDARHYQHRLDTVAPGWETAYEFIKPDGSLVKCRLTIKGVTREEVGESDPEENNIATSAVAQSFKRACAAFGLGRYLYFLPQVWSDYDPQSRRIITPPALPAWAKPGGSGYPGKSALSDQAGPEKGDRESAGQGKGGGKAPRSRKAQAAEPQAATPEALEPPAAMSPEEAAAVIFTLRPKTRPELAGKTLGEVAIAAPDILVWLAEQYTPTPETEQLREAARILIQ